MHDTFHRVVDDNGGCFLIGYSHPVLVVFQQVSDLGDFPVSFPFIYTVDVRV